MNILRLSQIITVLFSISCFAQIDWTWRNPQGQGFSLNSITYGNKQYVAVGIYGTILTSADGRSWTIGNSGITAALNSIAYSDSQYVAVGEDGIILTSPAVDVSVEKNQPPVKPTTLCAQHLSTNSLRITLPQALRSSTLVASIFTIAGKKLNSSTIATPAGEACVSSINLPAGSVMDTECSVSMIANRAMVRNVLPWINISTPYLGVFLAKNVV
ncbi:MAG: hypothetical protein A2268_00945 [Candidatus Raymondbacteria bacterium RifOxyA12_full_50_37]|uniref:Photosynthesis system II assembly factor Ycf48/Hcf136-like domain-containing protein n=1 Tax=Candidatus Raymondbacteria bacterium RIFOXYD12_FULL_49_13 TaxID=1817890 RepID=A0A1F7FFY3_UNCRA|nr:MAG: hypothetical protein A2268_00945 [Candidatus Raymondbacteria bacterium RifOxyA12_full_50_37]OGJ86370.1 MAG: hypothetical protein A2248_13910 [Candidatus Raymondbacteria bacterium RIFOXYA2_FULL_49_16]OGJ95540.1 MAG: hypothetical protein A2453_12685 [Candidatus Raymondbacteria bacterium RIFOXYC2_FULL_50_21]OGJ96099.1 MAG: hypothetical protein A2487_01700 [Candidatus Raymondbacteria bacterium RifOxyC12_full_50_8]OGK04521.1 MAG: hypothetical protein A2350_17995 [Candidatus Raymondbacteria b